VTAPAAQRCYRHPYVETYARCTRCSRPICPDCMVPASVGHQCPECVAEGRPQQRIVDARRALAGRRPYVTYALIAACVAMMFLAGGGTDLGQLYRFGASFGPALADGQWWRLITPMFLHAGLFHIAFNMMALYIYGSSLERLLGPARFLALYLASGFFGNALSVSMRPCAVGVGASGAVFGVLGAFAAYYFRRRRASALADQMLRGIGALIAINLLFGFTVSGIDNWAHIGGLAAGTVIGVAADEITPRPRWQAVALVAGAVVVVIAVGIALVVTQVTSLTPVQLLRRCAGR